MAVRQLDHGLAALIRLPDDGEALGPFNRQRPQEHRVHGAEDRAVGANGERDGQHGGDREGRGLAQVAKCMTKVDHAGHATAL
jgi:hypothetical protein